MLSAGILMSLLYILPATVHASFADHEWNPMPHIPYVDEPDESKSVFHQSTKQLLSSYKTVYYFDQLIDHYHPEKGTFKQRYWHSYEFYEPGAFIEVLRHCNIH